MATARASTKESCDRWIFAPQGTLLAYAPPNPLPAYPQTRLRLCALKRLFIGKDLKKDPVALALRQRKVNAVVSFHNGV